MAFHYVKEGYHYDEDDNEIEGPKQAVTTGCGCCSTEIDIIPENYERLKEMAQSSANALKELCNELDLDINELL